MIKQDNRPNDPEDKLDKKMRLLKNLLTEASVSEEGQKEKSFQKGKNRKLPSEETDIPDKTASDQPPVINVSGNNNIISTGRSKVLIVKEDKKIRLLKTVIFCVLFF